MKNFILFVFLFCSVVFTHSGCSNEVDVIGVWKDIPVVYAILSNDDSINYIRIERAYLPPNQSAYDVAKIADSLYFDTSEVKVSLFKVVNTDTVPWPVPLEFVNLSDEGITRDSGIFADDPAYAYKMTGYTDEREIILKIENFKTGNVFYAPTESVRSTSDDNLILSPAYYLNPTFKPVKWREDDSNGDEVYTFLSVKLLGNGFASIYDYKFRFHYDEFQVDNAGVKIPGTTVSKSVEWKAASDYIPFSPSQTQVNIYGEAFYQFLAEALSDVTGTSIRRCVGELEVYVDGASESLRDYIVARQANEGFVGGLYPADPYSNVDGGYGVFATSDRIERKDRATDPRLMLMSDKSIDFIKSGDLTKNLGFNHADPCN